MNKSKIVKAAAWAAAPKMMFAAKNPRKAALLKATRWAVGRVRPEPKRSLTGRNAAVGLGAAALAVPLGLWLGRKLRQDDEWTTAR
ncbi:MAG TPA: hypothetical protein VGR37_10930 [Longimicrobiaceae bacterium]|nr:hypothetical protein [Longimicrobiaceae bacterium]